jgi:hypothetical protein
MKTSEPFNLSPPPDGAGWVVLAVHRTLGEPVIRL